MTKLAKYEQVEMKEEIKSGNSSMFEYVAFNTLKNVIGYSIAYIVVWFGISYFYTGYLLQDRFLEQYDIVVNLIIIPLFLLMIVTIALSVLYYRNKYFEINEKISDYKESLNELNMFYGDNADENGKVAGKEKSDETSGIDS